MSKLNHVSRRGAIYVWRRRLPARISKVGFLQVSLRTSRFSTAKMLANVVNSAFATSILDMERKRITKVEAQRALAGLVSQALERIEEERYFEPAAKTPDEWRQRYLRERCRAEAMRHVAVRGSASGLSETDCENLAKQGFSKVELSWVADEIEGVLAEISSDKFQENSRRLASGAFGRTDLIDPDLRAMASLRLTAEAEAMQRSDRNASVLGFGSLDVAEVVAAQFSADMVPATAVSQIDSIGTSEDRKPRFSHRLKDLIESHIATRDRKTNDPGEQNKIRKDVSQRRAVLGQFVEAIGLEEMSDLRQDDLYHYVSVLERLPKIYRRSPEDRNLTLSEILERAEELPVDEVGLSANTINRNITILQGFLDHAFDKGAKPAEDLRLSRLRKAIDDDERAARLAFSEEDISAIASHPIWSGCRSDSRRYQKGEKVLKDALYWGPIIASVTGARREEILGSKLADVIVDHSIPHFFFRKNANRRLKNAASERYVPIHSILFELGFDEYVAVLKERGETDLFPDLKPTNETSSFGDVFYKKWKPILDQQLCEKAERKTFHSFRHRFITYLRFEEDVPKDAVKDLVGHKHQDETDGRYRKTIEFRDKVLNNLSPIVERIPADYWSTKTMMM